MCGFWINMNKEPDYTAKRWPDDQCCLGVTVVLTISVDKTWLHKSLVTLHHPDAKVKKNVQPKRSIAYIVSIWVTEVSWAKCCHFVKSRCNGEAPSA